MTDTTKKCIRCGAALPEEAAFCPCCTASQIHRRTIPVTPPAARRNQWWVGALAALVALALPVGAVLWSSTARVETLPEDTTPLTAYHESEDGAEKRYSALCQTYYEGEDGQLYHVFASFSPGIDGSSTMRGYRSALLEPDCTDTGPLTLFVDEAASGRNGRDSFSALLEDWSVTVTAPDGGERCTLSAPTFDYISTTDALLYQELTGTSACADNEIVWTLRMKNGDVVTVKQGVTYSPKTVVEYHWEDTPMNTAAELQALLDDIARRYDADTKVQLQLPAVTYDAPLQIACPVELLGSGTVFAAPVTVASLTSTERSSAHARFRDVTFAAADGGTGLSAAAPVYLERCRFTGWDVAAQAVDGGWVYCQSGSTFSGNGTALRFSVAYTDSFGFPSDTEFSDNDVAVQVERLPDGVWLRLENCRFLRNGTDISNPRQYRVDTDTTYFA